MKLELPQYIQTVLLPILNRLFYVVICFVRFVLSVYWGKGSIVPLIQNPLLLKSATTLAKEIREGKLKSEDVVRAYMKRIQEVEPYINATVECVFEDALRKARQADELVASGKYTTDQLAEDKPLLGVPISIKHLLNVKGLLSTAGSAFFKDVRATEDSPSVALMKKAGAIVMVTTNTPECGLILESNNLMYGRTRNPYNTSRTSGGSSGGESALIGAGGSILGLGNDAAGSIRLPCSFTGLFGHKPSRDLVPNGGVTPVPDETFMHFVSTGPMCRYAEDLVTSLKVLTSQNESLIPFGKQVDLKKIKICYMLELKDPLVSPLDPEIEASLMKAVSYFETQYGTAAKRVTLPFMKNINLCTIHLVRNAASNMKHTITGGKGLHINEKTDLIKFFFGKSTFSLWPLITLNVTKYPLYNKAHVPYYQEMLRKLIQEFDDLLDEDTVLFFPTFPVTAPYHEEMLTRILSIGYTSVFNLIGLPGTQCPLGFDKEGLPYGMQIIGRLNNDALTVACAVELEKVFGGWIPPGNV